MNDYLYRLLNRLQINLSSGPYYNIMSTPSDSIDEFNIPLYYDILNYIVYLHSYVILSKMYNIIHV